MEDMQKPTTESLQPTTGRGCPGTLNDMYPPAISAKRLNHSAPIGLLQPIPIPSQPFKVVSMDFIPELPFSNGFDNILVIMDKLTKYAIFIPTTTMITEVGTAKLFFHHIISKFGIPRQVITDRNIRWQGELWKKSCNRMR